MASPAGIGHAGNLDLSWTAPSANEDQTLLTNLTEYRIYFRTSSPACAASSFLSMPSSTPAPAPGQMVSSRVTGLSSGTTYYFQVTATNTAGAESDCSNEASGVAKFDFAVTPTGTVDFGSVAVGGSVTRTFTVQNTSSVPVSGSVVSSGPFKVGSGGTISLGAGASQAVTVSFNPTATGTFAGNVNFSANGDTVSRGVTGTATSSSSYPTPAITTLSPSSATAGGPGFTVTVIGTNFVASSVVRWNGANRTTTFASSTQLQAAVPSSDILGAETAQVTVFTPAPGGGTSNALAFTVNPNSSALLLASVAPTTGAPDQTLQVALNGGGFVSGATCSFGSGITVSACTFTSSVRLTASVTIATNATLGPRTVTVTNPGGPSASLSNAFTVTTAGSVSRYSFTYASRSALLAAGWDFLARTATGASRNTEQTGSLSVNYDQTAHPGTLRIPVGIGEIWRDLNNSENTLFRDLPADWSSVRLGIAAFAPVANYQQVGLLVYENDDNYVNLNWAYINDPGLELFAETNGVVNGKASQIPLSASANLALRLDRDPSTNVFTAAYSTDGGTSWIPLPGSVTKAMTSPQLAIQVGANQTATLPTADLTWAEVVRATQAPPPASRINFTYGDRAALLAGGWDFVARTPSGGSRNTEQTGALTIDYNQTTHPGTIRIPLGPGELWQTLNDSQNMVFRDLPPTWTSIRLKIAAFNPVADFQQVGLIAYQDDNTYVTVERYFSLTAGGPLIGFFEETDGVVSWADRRSLTNSGNLILRLDRAPATQVLSAFYSVDSGVTWIQLAGTSTQVLADPRLAIQVGANVTGISAVADLAWVEIY